MTTLSRANRCWRSPTQGDEERWWRELQLAAPASAGGLRAQRVSGGECAANFGLFFNEAVLTFSK
jgi:hypothetical protein